MRKCSRFSAAGATPGSSPNLFLQGTYSWVQNRSRFSAAENSVNMVHKHRPGTFEVLGGCRAGRRTTLFQPGSSHRFRIGPMGIFSSSSFERPAIQLHRAPTLEGALNVFLWACRHVARVTPFGDSAIVVTPFETSIPHVVRFHLLSTFPFQELDQVALASHRGRSADMHRALSPFEARGS